ncbi:type IVB secretion system protein IcmH/DotU [Pseudomonas japonica]|uniref:type IVB secretion system protein IcmH/DotU n=1 Tax=Pseudomonas japonica TaxID=256466 RepID=UPI0015E31150|nr:type IVB secretion system protein IcmH/DotU [Pseudomonas japonica]MBA1245059.1 DotU family type IV/VI secretion system protein [Pseudomonas japonica]
MTEAVAQEAVTAATEKPSLKSLTHDFISMALIVRKGRQATCIGDFTASIEAFFIQLEREARAAHYSVEQVRDAQYALCAFLDESVLSTEDSELRRHFELQPSQFRYFQVHLAGEGFFEKIETLRADIQENLDVLEVYHLCLALGFEGKYSIGEKDQLRYLANTLGQDIARYRPASHALSTDWALPDPVPHVLRRDVPLWVYLALIVLVCLAVYLALDHLLSKDVARLAEQIDQLFGK